MISSCGCVLGGRPGMLRKLGDVAGMGGAGLQGKGAGPRGEVEPGGRPGMLRKLGM